MLFRHVFYQLNYPEIFGGGWDDSNALPLQGLVYSQPLGPPSLTCIPRNNTLGGERSHIESLDPFYNLLQGQA